MEMKGSSIVPDIALSSPTSTLASSPVSEQGREFPVPPPIVRKYTGIHRLYIDSRAYISNLLSLLVLCPFVTMAMFQTAKSLLFDTGTKRAHDNILSKIQEDITLDETYYIHTWGFDFEIHHVETPDGFILKLYRLFRKDTRGKRPVLIGHGLFQCSGVFVLNEEKSLAFTLVDQGYDVWVGNHRCAAGLDHVSLSHKDPEFWDWGLREIGEYDFTTLIQYVKLQTGYPKVAYIGHSQGNAQAFIALSLKPEVSNDISCFIALAPAVYAGHLIRRFPLNMLIQLSDWMFSFIFGIMSFLPFMSTAQTTLDPSLYSFLAYSMFVYLFDWWDHHWVRRRKVKYFRFTPRPVSTRLISDWLSGWGRQGVCLYVQQNEIRPVHHPKVPLVVFYGTADHIVDGERLVNTLTNKSNQLFPTLELVHAERIEGYEHMDTIWAHDNHKTTYPIILENLAKWS